MHVVTAMAPAVSLYVPAGQKTHKSRDSLPLADEYLPAGHCLQDADDVAPSASLYFPATHGPHWLAFVPDLKRPGGHCSHTLTVPTAAGSDTS